MAKYSIGEMARRTGVKVTTIRFYETRGCYPNLAEQKEGSGGTESLLWSA